MRELDVVGRIGVDEVAALERHRFHVTGGERPAGEHFAVRREVACVRDPHVLTERHVEFARPVEPAEAVVAGPVEVVEERARFALRGLAARQHRVEPVAMLVEQLLVVLHREIDAKAVLKPTVEVDDVRVGVVQERARGHQAERHREAAAEGLDEAAARVRRPDGLKVRHLPPLAARPLEGRAKHCGPLCRPHARSG